MAVPGAVADAGAARGGRPDEASAAAAGWLTAFGAALAAADTGAVARLFDTDGHWRDLLAIGWNLSTHSGREAIQAFAATAIAQARPGNFRLAARRTPPRRVLRAGVEVLEAMFEFDTAIGAAQGVLRLVPERGAGVSSSAATGAVGPAGSSGPPLRAWILLTALDSIRGHEEHTGQRRPRGDDYAREFGGDNWLDRRRRARAFEDRDPAVLVVGAGQAGLSIGARLGQLGIDTLIIDREQRIGDNWRRRYHSLTLHNEVFVNHLPYMPFPDSWPVFIPKDKLANWFEAYVEGMELNCWTGTELVAGERDQAHGCWRVSLRLADGSLRTMSPRHLVFANGVSAMPVMPRLPGLDDFGGTVLHLGAYTEGSAWRGKRALVLGTGNSGHDVAQDLQASGAQVTMVQRSPSYVVGIREAQRVYSLYAEGMPLDDCDLLATAMPYPVLRQAYQLSTEMSRYADRALLDGLAARGFQLDFGEDQTGFQMMYLRRGGGYYFNVGCSDLIVDGRVALLQFDRIDSFVQGGVRLLDGSVLPADLLVLATGYLNQQEVVRASLGDRIADAVGPVWNFDAGGELRNMWRPTTQAGLWFTAGSLAQCRIYSRYLALQIKARELGIARD